MGLAIAIVNVRRTSGFIDGVVRFFFLFLPLLLRLKSLRTSLLTPASTVPTALALATNVPAPTPRTGTRGTAIPTVENFNSYHQGNTTLDGPGSDFTIDTTKKISVVTQFIKGSDGNLGNLGKIKRLYVPKTVRLSPTPRATLLAFPGTRLPRAIVMRRGRSLGTQARSIPRVA